MTLNLTAFPWHCKLCPSPKQGNTVLQRYGMVPTVRMLRGCSVLQMIFNSGPLLAVIIVDMIALLMYNFSGMCVTGEQPLLLYHVAHQPYAFKLHEPDPASAGCRISPTQAGCATAALSSRCWPCCTGYDAISPAFAQRACSHWQAERPVQCCCGIGALHGDPRWPHAPSQWQADPREGW